MMANMLFLLLALASVQFAVSTIVMDSYHSRENACFTSATTVYGKTLLQCADECTAGKIVSNCFGFNYLDNPRICMLSNSLPEQASKCADNSITYAPAFQLCPDGWHYYSARDVCIKAHETAVDSGTAQTVCQSYGTLYGKTGRVIEFPSSTDYEWFKTNRNTLAGSLENNNFQIGLEKISGVWVWRSSNTANSFTQWHTNEPSGDGVCVEIYQSDVSYNWNDCDCSSSRYTFCELQL